METVMVLWQLETGNPQFLPHLTAAIRAIVVSPSGTLYGVRTSDNAAMVLSTANLEPTVSVQGIQLPGPPTPRSLSYPVTALQSSGSLRILFAAPATTDQSSASATYLQTVDASTGSTLGKQALTRTNVTDRNVNPEGVQLTEPNVALLEVSRDGKWLATVDQWVPPKQDLDYLALDEQEQESLQLSKMEIYLRFWSWNEDSKTWELGARVDAPHLDANGASSTTGRVYNVVSEPTNSGFITFGSDNMAKFWAPKIRYRHGQEVHDAAGVGLKNWVCRATVPVPRPLSYANESTVSNVVAKMAVSADGSLLVIAQQTGAEVLVSLIDANSGSVCWSRKDLVTSSILSVGIVDRYLILLFKNILIWDLVKDTVHRNLPLETSDVSEQSLRADTQLAIDHQTGTFAVSTATSFAGKKPKGGKSLHALAIFDVKTASKLCSIDLSHPIQALIPAVQRKGYYYIDSLANIRLITPSASFANELDAVPELEAPAAAETIKSNILANIIGNASAASAQKRILTKEISHAAGAQHREVSQHDLSEIFATATPYALPPITHMFEQVARLFVGKTTPV